MNPLLLQALALKEWRPEDLAAASGLPVARVRGLCEATGPPITPAETMALSQALGPHLGPRLAGATARAWCPVVDYSRAVPPPRRRPWLDLALAATAGLLLGIICGLLLAGRYVPAGNSIRAFDRWTGNFK